MKLSKLKALCKESGVLRLFDRYSGPPPADAAPAPFGMPEVVVREEGGAELVPYVPADEETAEAESVLLEQWMGDNYCIFPLRRFPVLSEGALYAMLDWSAKETEKISYYHSADLSAFDLADVSEAELQLEAAPFSLLVGGREMLPLFGAERPIFIDTKYLGPVADESEMQELYLRLTADGGAYVAVKSGMVLIGIILPQVGLSVDNTEQLAALAGMCTAYQEDRRRRAEDAQRDSGEGDGDA